jgi:hypothetical protein
MVIKHADAWKKRGFLVPLCGAVLCCYSIICAGQQEQTSDNSFSIPFSNPVYSYIDALPFPGITEGVDLAVRPFSENQTVTLLKYALSHRLASDTVLAKKYLREFINQDSAHVASLFVGDSINRIVVYPYIATAERVQDSNFTEKGYTAFSVDSLSNKTETYNMTDFGLRLRALVFDAPVYFDGAITTEYSSIRQWLKIDSPHLGENLTTILSKRGDPGHFIGHDQFTTYFKIPNPFLNIAIGNEPFEWGYSDGMGFLFSGDCAPFFNIRYDKRIGKLKYEFVLGKLVANSYGEQRLVYAKRMTYQPVDWLSLGYNDQEISTGHPLQALYLLPFVPYYFTGHYLGDPDNLLMCFDGQARMGRHVSVYGQVGIDDIKDLLGPLKDITSSGNKDWGNKWSGLAGVKILHPVPWFESFVKLEYLDIEPWTYTTSVNASDNYPVHFGSLLGNGYGPHSRVLRLVGEGQLSNGLIARITAEQLWKGKDPSGPSTPGSGVDDINPVVTDTVNGIANSHYEYPTKDDRFRYFSRNRTYFSGSIKYRPTAAWEVDAGLSLVYEQEPKPAPYYQLQIGGSINY